MKRVTSLVLAGAVSVAVLVPVWAQREKTRAATPEGMARSIALDLREARTLLDRVLDKRTQPQPREGEGARDREVRKDADSDRSRLEMLLENSERDARSLEREITRLRDQSYSQWNDAPRGRTPMRDSDFDQVLFALRRAPTAGDEMRIVRQVAAEQWISSRQLRDLIKVLDQPRNQEEASALLYARLSDPGRFYTIRDSFKSDSSWENVCRKLGIR